VASNIVERKLAAILAAWVSGTLLADDSSFRIPAAEATLAKTLSLAPNHAWAHYLLGIIKIFTNRTAQGIAECEHALALDRNLAAAHRYIGDAKYFVDRSEETKILNRKSFGLTPSDSNPAAGRTRTGFIRPGRAVTRFRPAGDINQKSSFGRRLRNPRSARISSEGAKQPLPQERRRFRRTKSSVPGRYMLDDRREFPCHSIDISPGGIGLMAPVPGEIGTRVVVYLEQIGRIEGFIVRELENGFAVKIVARESRRPLFQGLEAECQISCGRSPRENVFRVDPGGSAAKASTAVPDGAGRLSAGHPELMHFVSARGVRRQAEANLEHD
jgi:PilZ domain